jgi:hypothetical protein
MSHGYIASALGAIGGAVGLGVSVGVVLAQIPCRDEGFECLGVAIVAFFGGAVAAAAGGALGCYVALRLRHHPKAGVTAWLFVGMLAASALAAAFVIFPVLGDVAAPVAGLLFLATPLAARRLAVGAKPQVKPPTVDI